ncbi:hypothetical protein NDU88_001131 [Pleurodeles waltl]|uniref:Uncharacterized protein n=1 Tax=Pleurodeles waltl TaxID=8319 RepID=A0AAV7V6Y3_PLEWA|nr:hypothetical protein NDU88_001131 [Pleurodeles waltl]
MYVIASAINDTRTQFMVAQSQQVSVPHGRLLDSRSVNLLVLHVLSSLGTPSPAVGSMRQNAEAGPWRRTNVHSKNTNTHSALLGVRGVFGRADWARPGFQLQSDLGRGAGAETRKTRAR